MKTAIICTCMPTCISPHWHKLSNNLNNKYLNISMNLFITQRMHLIIYLKIVGIENAQVNINGGEGVLKDMI